MPIKPTLYTDVMVDETIIPGTRNKTKLVGIFFKL